VKIFIILLIIQISRGDKICIGYQSNNSTDTVNTLIESNVPVTSSKELLESSHNGLLCSNEKGSPLVLTSCLVEGLIYGNPQCDSLLDGKKWSYIVERRNATAGVCYPGKIENLEELRSLFSSIESYKRVVLFQDSVWNVTYTGTSRACSGSFYRNMRWLTHKTNNYPVQETQYRNTEQHKILFMWGIHHPPTESEQNSLYRKADSTTSITTEEINRSFKPAIGPRPLVNGQQGRIDYYWGILKPGQTLKIKTNGNLIAPWYGHVLKGESYGRVLKTETPEGNCLVECQTEFGGLNTSLPFQNISKYAFGYCPKYIKTTSLRLATGLRNVPAIQTRGLFGAIAGFIEGGWPGLLAGWYGFQHSNAEGTGIAADQKSTQDALDKITSKVNNIVNKMNKQFEIIGHEFSEVEQRINSINNKIDDQVQDLWAYNAELLILLENQKTLDEHDANVKNLYDRVKRSLGENAKEDDNGCFQLLHKCNDECMETIRNGTYIKSKYEKESKLERQKIEGVKLEENETYKIMTIYSTVASSLVLTMGVAAFFIWAMSNGSCRCTICI
ncbi:hemagglutinin, partial [Influenza A virus]